jgi:hypothetical protein
MLGAETGDLNDGPLRRVDVELLIVHPTMAPAEITAALGLEAHVAHTVGEPRMTPKGTILKGQYQDTRWRHCIRYELNAQWFADRITMLVDRLAPHKEFLARVRATGGHATLVLQFLGDGYLADNVPLDTLAKMADLQLDFGIECFVVPQA